MKTIYPTFYKDFRCRAGACAHSCCKGWEIDIDPETARRYLSAPPPLGDRLRGAIDFDGETWSFRLTGDERCPFLNSSGLCDIITAWGDGALCDICREHPRFYETVGEYELQGLGLACEEAASLLINAKELRFTDGGSEYDLPALIKETTGEELSFGPSFHPDCDPASVRFILALFGDTEPIDDRWTAELNALAAKLPETAGKAREYCKTYDGALYDRIYQYILYRQLERAEYTELRLLERYAHICASYIFIADACGAGTAEAARRFSEQIEYSTENVDIIIDGIPNP